MLRSPREIFVTSSHKSAFKTLVQTDAFEAASQAALSLLVQEVAVPGVSPNQAADGYNQITGAKRYLELLCSIHEPEPQPKETPHHGLDDRAGV